MSNNEKPFLYQINFNRKKFPEVCKRLDEAKNSENGLAWYLRSLIERDIEERNGTIQPQQVQEKTKIINSVPLPIEKQEVNSKPLEIQSKPEKQQEDPLSTMENGGFI